MSDKKGKNIGEWSEMYIFFKLMSDRKVYVADKDMNRLKDVFLNIISIIREEDKGYEYRYFTGDIVKITLNGKQVAEVDVSKFTESARRVWNLITSKKDTTFSDSEIVNFLTSIFIKNISSPAQKKSHFFGGTADIVLDTMDYRSGVSQIMGFSCKSDIDAASTLFNASGDNTNFEFEIVGNMTDDIMKTFNAMYHKVIKKGEAKYEVATGERMRFLKSNGFDLRFVKPTKDVAGQNLIRCGGLETPKIVGGLLKYFYFECAGASTGIEEAINYLAENDFVGYGFDNLYATYRVKIANLLYAMFTGLRFSKPWSGRSDVNGGYIVVKRDGDVVAFHSCIADEFKDFLIDKLKFEAPSCSRHKYMDIYKKSDGKYYIKLALQFRFKLKNK